MASKSRKLWADKINSQGNNQPSLTKQKNKSTPEEKFLGKMFDGVVLGIDPSLRGTGLAILEVKKGKITYKKSLTVRNSTKLSQAECLLEIFEKTQELIKEYKPQFAAIEQSVYVQNYTTAITLGAARGAAITAAAKGKLGIFEYPPLRIKQAVVGYGRASKQQVQKNVEAMIDNAGQLSFDEADAVATALTFIFTHKF